MPRVSIITRGTRGVDMKSNPLSLGNQKLQSATNVIFDEGNIRSRFGFQYTNLGIKGDFQGAHEHRSSRGISSSDFGDGTLKLVVAADGKIHVNDINSEGVECEPTIIGDGFSCKGDVNLFSAENYLIVQNDQSSTYWWDGREFTKSPGSVEYHFDDPDVDFTETSFKAPVGEVPDCYPDSEGSQVKLIFINSVSKNVIPGVYWQVTYNKNVSNDGISGIDGSSTFNLFPRDYRLNTSKSSYVPKTQYSLDFSKEDTVVVELDPINKVCGAVVESSGFGEESLPVAVGPGIGPITFAFNAKTTPSRFVVEYDGVVVVDTGYRGSSTFDAALIAAGFTATTGPALGNITFVKKTKDPGYATVTVYTPINPIDWGYTVACPPNPPNDSGGSWSSSWWGTGGSSGSSSSSSSSSSSDSSSNSSSSKSSSSGV